MKKFTFITFLLAFAFHAHANPPIITGAHGVSRYKDLKTPVLFGGMVGLIPSVTDGAHTVDTCALNGKALTACNTESVYGGLALKVYAKHRQHGNLLIGRSDRTLLPPAVRPNTEFASVRWDDLCVSMGQVACMNLSGSSSDSFKIFVDHNGNNLIDSDEEGAPFVVHFVHVPESANDLADESFGLTGFTPHPGKNRVHIKDPVLAAPGTLFTSYGAPIQDVRVFMSDINMTEATPGSGLSPVDLHITPRGTITNATIAPLTKDRRIWFRLGMVDAAGNVTSFFPPKNTEGCDVGGMARCSLAATPL